MSAILLLNLEAPLMSFGGVAIDNRGVEMPFPAVSLITGLLANALGYRREHFEQLQRLQDRLRLCLRIDREGDALLDFQTAKLEKADQGWTTLGIPEGRDGGSNTYDNKHLRYRDYHADRRVTVALLLEPSEEEPTLQTLLYSLKEPQRPLYIGRKCCLPSAQIALGIVEKPTLLDALSEVKADSENARIFEAIPHGAPYQVSEHRVSGLRQWRKQLHGGEQRWLERTQSWSNMHAHTTPKGVQ